MATAIEDPNPVMIFEHKALYRSIADEIPDSYYTVAAGEGKVVSEGDEITIVTYGMGVHWALKAQEELPEIAIEIIDLRTLIPWDQKIIRQSLTKTGKLLVLHEDTLTGGIGAEIAAWVSEYCFTLLDAPVVRVASLDTPVPFTPTLENNFLANARLVEKLKELTDF